MCTTRWSKLIIIGSNFETTYCHFKVKTYMRVYLLQYHTARTKLVVVLSEIKLSYMKSKRKSS